LSAGRALEPIGGSSTTGEVFSESQFLASWSAGTQDFQDALASLRAAGVRGLVSATDGHGIFTGAGCATCHTLAAAQASGTVGPNLDEAKPLKPDVVSAVTNGSGVMLSFKGTLSAAQIQAVADFVSQNAGK
jgi:mono/diheme cytochrome c family protein